MMTTLIEAVLAVARRIRRCWRRQSAVAARHEASTAAITRSRRRGLAHSRAPFDPAPGLAKTSRSANPGDSVRSRNALAGPGHRLANPVDGLPARRSDVRLPRPSGEGHS